MKTAVWWSATSLSFVDVLEGLAIVVFSVEVFCAKDGGGRVFRAKCYFVLASSKLIIIHNRSIFFSKYILMRNNNL
jgi:hypothetical protein